MDYELQKTIEFSNAVSACVHMSLHSPIGLSANASSEYNQYTAPLAEHQNSSCCTGQLISHGRPRLHLGLLQ